MSVHPTPHPTVVHITDEIRRRSAPTRSRHLAHVAAAKHAGPSRGRISCTNLAHAFAAEAPKDKLVLREIRAPNIGIVSAYNDMLSAHQPLARFPTHRTPHLSPYFPLRLDPRFSPTCRLVE
jgi:phosphogluconate dehydratase